MTQQDNLINGKWAESDTRTPNVNPSDHSDVIGHFASGTASDARDAIAAAAAAKGAWRRVGAGERADMLERIGDAILERREYLGTLLAREEGKTRREGIGEAVRAGNTFKYFAAAIFNDIGSALPSRRPNTTIDVRHSPVGSVGIITPWNFPLAVPAWKIAPALAYGNTVVFKPADLVPASAHALATIIHEAGLPDGVFNLVMGRGSVIGNEMVHSTELDAITFTGSTSVGSALVQGSIAHGNKRVQAEMGGKNSAIVLDDAALDLTVDALIDSAFMSTGQRCTATSRIIATPGIHDELVERLAERVRNLRIGHALEESSEIGPVASASQLRQDLDYIEIACAEGAELVAGGSILERPTTGNFLQPALFAGTSSAMRINQEEVFGPVASVIAAASLDEAIAIANSTQYGLSSGIFSNSQSAITAFSEEIESGLISVNCSPAISELQAPFGGVKNSGYGPREQGGYARDFYTSVSTRYVSTAPAS